VKRRRIHAQCRAGALHQGVQGRNFHPEQEGNPEHALIADQSDLQAGAGLSGCSQRDEAIRGEVDVANVLAGFHQHDGKRQVDRFAAPQNMPTVLVRQGRKQAIVGGV
jgi:hypothetical protein